MKRIVRFRFPIVAAAAVMLAHPHDSLAGFEWIGWWNESRSGNAQSLSGIELPNGVLNMGAILEGSMSSGGFKPPILDSPSASIVLSRHFRLTGSPGGWQVDLDWHEVESHSFSLHLSYYRPWPSLSVSTFPGDPVRIVPSGSSLMLSDGDYLFTVSASGRLTLPPPMYITYPYIGTFHYRFAASLKATAVPEPASWLMIGQGCFAATGIMVISKRRQRHGGRTASG